MNLQIFTIILSFSAFCLSLYTYFKHDAKLKKQTSLINSFQLEKFNKEKDSDKKAMVEANIVKQRLGKRVIKVYNKGKSTAKNVQVKIQDLEGVEIINNPFPIDIKPQNSYEIDMFLTNEAPDTIRIEFEWQDEFAEKNSDYQILQL